MIWKKLMVALALVMTTSLATGASASASPVDEARPDSEVGLAQSSTSPQLAVTREGCTATRFAATHGGLLDVYVGYTSANGGTNCAWAEKRAGSGPKEKMSISLWRCVAGTKPGASDCTVDRGPGGESGYFHHYVGPGKRLTQTAGRCIVADVYYQGKMRTTPAGRCG